jgi:hypothetical protein
LQTQYLGKHLLFVGALGVPVSILAMEKLITFTRFVDDIVWVDVDNAEDF